MHTVADYLDIQPNEVEAKYDDIERELLIQFYNFARDRREKYWVHWNMRNVVFGFEHLEHRYRSLTKTEPPSIPVEVRIDLNDILKNRYGNDYAKDPKMPSLMEMNGGKVQGFLSGKEESDAFKPKDFIRMHTSIISKVGFFSFVITSVCNGKLITAARGLMNAIDRMLDSRKARVIAACSAVIGLLVGLVQLLIWLMPIVIHAFHTNPPLPKSPAAIITPKNNGK